MVYKSLAVIGLSLALLGAGCSTTTNQLSPGAITPSAAEYKTVSIGQNKGALVKFTFKIPTTWNVAEFSGNENSARSITEFIAKDDCPESACLSEFIGSQDSVRTAAIHPALLQINSSNQQQVDLFVIQADYKNFVKPASLVTEQVGGILAHVYIPSNGYTGAKEYYLPAPGNRSIVIRKQSSGDAEFESAFINLLATFSLR